MGSKTLHRCQALQEKLIEAGIPPGTRLPRRIWDETLVRSLGIGWVQAQNITRDGDLNGLWIRHQSHGPKQGSIELLAPEAN